MVQFIARPNLTIARILSGAIELSRGAKYCDILHSMAHKAKYYLGRLSVWLRGLKFKKSYSQLNEDAVLDWLTGYKDRGTYIDIGAYNPDKISNTKLFYERGWRGVNIEPDPIAFEAFKLKRPLDININTAIGQGDMEYFAEPGEHAGNTFNTELAKERGLTEHRMIHLTPLRDIFKNNQLTYVDFMSIDVEGFENEVLKSNDWQTYRAGVICLEGYRYDYLLQFGYKRVFWDGSNCYYQLSTKASDTI